MSEGQDVNDFLQEMQVKVNMISPVKNALRSPEPNKRNIAFTRYADEVFDPEFRERLQHPMGEPFKRLDPSNTLFRVQKTEDHWSIVSRSKQFLAKDFFPPRNAAFESELKSVLEDQSLSEQELCLKLLDVIPNLNHDQLIELTLYLSFEL